MNAGSDSKKITTLNFGCRLNAYEVEIMQHQAQKAGLGKLDGGAILVNTCAVTGEAVRQAKQAIRKARRQSPDAKIIVSGCAAQTSGEEFAQMAEVDLVIGNEDKLHANAYRALPEFGVNDYEKLRVNDIMEVRTIAPQMLPCFDDKNRAFVQVQNGCDHRCTFCIIPYGRGNSRSVPAGRVVDEIARLVENGFAEIVLTGVDLTSWGADLPGKPRLGFLVRNILDQIPHLQRLRLSSIDSIEVDGELFEALAEEKRLLPHLHLSLQHGDNLILKRMKRRHLREDAIGFCQKLLKARPEMVFGADLMAGFPTETEAAFENTLSLIDECGLTHIHAFPFSPRPGTPAAKMPQLDRAIIKQRAARLRQKADAVFNAHLACYVGKTCSVLLESGGRGHNSQFVPVHVETGTDSKLPPRGTLVDIAITGVKDNALIGMLPTG